MCVPITDLRAPPQRPTPASQQVGFGPIVFSLLFFFTCFESSSAAALSPRHLQLVVCINGQKRVIPYPNPSRGVTVGSVWTDLQTKTDRVTVIINSNPPPVEVSGDGSEEEDYENFVADGSDDDDADF